MVCVTRLLQTTTLRRIGRAARLEIRGISLGERIVFVHRDGAIWLRNHAHKIDSIKLRFLLTRALPCFPHEKSRPLRADSHFGFLGVSDLWVNEIAEEMINLRQLRAGEAFSLLAPSMDDKQWRILFIAVAAT